MPLALSCGRVTAGIAGSNPAEGMVIRLSCLLFVVEVAASVTSRSLFQGSPTVCVCVSVCLSV